MPLAESVKALQVAFYKKYWEGTSTSIVLFIAFWTLSNMTFTATCLLEITSPEISHTDNVTRRNAASSVYSDNEYYHFKVPPMSCFIRGKILIWTGNYNSSCRPSPGSGRIIAWQATIKMVKSGIYFHKNILVTVENINQVSRWVCSSS